MKLTGFSKFLIIAIILGVVGFLAYKFAPRDGVSTVAETTQQVDTPTSAPKAATKTVPSKTSSSASTTPFNYTPTAPRNGVLKGVVELGASGFNSFIIKTDGKNWSLEKAEWGNSLVYDNMSSAADIRAGLKSYIGKMLDYGVDGRKIHFVVSSGAKKVPTTKSIISELKSMKYVVNEVTPEQEGTYALKCVLPDNFKANAFVVDIGSGNTKISWDQGGKIESLETFGAKYYKNNISDDKAINDVRVTAAKIPKHKTKQCFIIGGVPFSLAKEVRNEKERYTVLKNAADYSVEGKKMESGLAIYKAIQEVTGCKQFIFDWDSNFTIGFLLKTK